MIQENSNIFGLKNPTLGSSSSADGHEGCCFSLEDASRAATDIGLLENGHKNGENNLVDSDWPDISSFEDIDAFLRNSDSTIGQESAGTGDELSWFSSLSHTIHGSESTLVSGFQSSCSKLIVLNGTRGLCGTSNNFNLEKEPSNADYDKCCSLIPQSNEDWFDISTKNKEMHAHEEQPEKAYGGNEIKMSTLSQMSSEIGINCHDSSSMLEGPFSLSARRKDHASENTSNAPQIYTSQPFSQQNHALGSSLNKGCISGHNIKLGNCLVTDQVPFTSTISITKLENTSNTYPVSDHIMHHAYKCMEEVPDHFFRHPVLKPDGKLEELHIKQQVSSTTLSVVSCQKGGFGRTDAAEKRCHKFQREIGNDDDKESQNMEHPTVGIAISTLQENSCMTFEYSEDTSVEATSLRALEDTMRHLDVSSRLCIRDGLYRLARSAERRQNIANINKYREDNSDRRGVKGAESSNCPEFIGAETDTNYMDRSISHLLFHNPENARRLPDDAASLENPKSLSTNRVMSLSMPVALDVCSDMK